MDKKVNDIYHKYNFILIKRENKIDKMNLEIEFRNC